MKKDDITKTITELFTELQDIKCKKWKLRCDAFIKWERSNHITKEQKHKKQKKLCSKSSEYKNLKTNLSNSIYSLTTIESLYILEEGRARHGTFYNIDNCGVLTSSE